LLMRHPVTFGGAATLTIGAVAYTVFIAALVSTLNKESQALRAALEAAEAASHAKSDFLAMASHEIRTPLNGVLGMAQALEHDTLSPVQRDRVSVIRQSGEALLEVLNDILDLAKIEAGKLELEVAPFDLEAVTRIAHLAFRPLAEEKGVGFGLSFDEAARGIHDGDAARVRQVLTNLISNALKFTEAGQVEVAVTAQAGGVRLAVSDTGPGVAADRIEHLFDRFAQADASITRRFGGTGLGLAICRDLCEAMGGAIRVESELGQGSRFIVDLPLPRSVSQALSAPAEAPAAALAQAAGSTPLRVLAAEDNAVNQLVLRTLLDQVGVDLTMVADGAEAVDAWEAGDFDLILMDIQMPRMDGPTAARAIRAREAASGRRRTPIIALTANAMKHQVDQYAAAGMDAFVAKPISVGELYNTMARLAGGDGESARAVA
ncbi:MAG: ATP-binding protein, partial [Phenylobacterium sp.]